MPRACTDPSPDPAGKVCQPGSQDTSPDTAIQHMVRFLLDKYPTAHVVMLGVLPKGSQWPNSCTPAQQRLNGALQQFAGASTRVHFLDVGTQFLLTDARGRQEINPMLLPDTLHPSLKGMQVRDGPSRLGAGTGSGGRSRVPCSGVK